MFYRRKMGKLLGSFSAFGVLAWQMADGFRKGCVFSIKYKYRYKHILCFTHHKTVYFVSLFLFFSFVFWVQYVLASRGGYGCPVCVRISLCCVSGSCTFHCAVLFFFPSWNELGQEVKELGIWVASACRMSVGSCGNGSLDHGPHPCCCLSTDPVGSSNSSHGTRMIFLFNLAIPP